jgi:uncharacterized membrane protein
VFHAWPAYVAYVVSFLTIGAAWLAHTALTDRLMHSDSIFLRLNLLGLLVVAFLPFPTRLVADALQHFDAERVAVTVYGLTLLAIRVLGPRWMGMHGASTSTRRLPRARSHRVNSENFCPS